jgi:hypothetical protein
LNSENPRAAGAGFFIERLLFNPFAASREISSRRHPMQVKRAAGFMIADTLHPATPARRVAETKDRGFPARLAKSMAHSVFREVGECL